MAQKTKKDPVKKTPVKKPSRPAAKPKKAAISKAVAVHRSFRRSDNPEFFSFQPTVQTAYWLILGVIIIGLTVWVYRLQQQITDIYDTIEINNAQDDTSAVVLKKLQQR